MTKMCTKCKIEKSVGEFYKNRRLKDSLSIWCKACQGESQKEYQQKYRASKHSKAYQKMYKRKYFSTPIGILRRTFYNINYRCNNPKDKAYKHYGGRGIQNKFSSSQEFIDYVVNVLKVSPQGLQIDRIDNNGHYEKGNIRFVTHKENQNNKRNSKKVLDTIT